MGLFGKKLSDGKGSPPPSDEKRASGASKSEEAAASGSSQVPPQYQQQAPPPGEPSPAYQQGPEIAMQPPQPPPGGGFQTHFACVSLNMSDRLRFLNFPPQDFYAAQEVVTAAWPKGIRHVRQYGMAMEIKMKGNPWAIDAWGSDRDAPRRLLRRLLEVLYNRGWVMQAPLDLSKKQYDKDTLIFRYQSPAPLPCDWLAVAFGRSDRLRFIDAPPPELSSAILATFGSMVTRHEIVGGTFEVKFQGYPWLASGTDTVNSRMMILNLLSTMEGFGWTLYACVDQLNSGDQGEADVMYFQRSVNWVPGAPVLHR